MRLLYVYSEPNSQFFAATIKLATPKSYAPIGSHSSF